MIIDEIKKANIEAMKNHDQNLRAIYSVLISKHLSATINARTAGGVVDDAEMTRIIQKTIKELEEESANYAKVGNKEKSASILKQKEVISKFLPQMMSRDEIKDIILGLEDKSVPFVMKYFKQNYNGKCEMKLVQEVFKRCVKVRIFFYFLCY